MAEIGKLLRRDWKYLVILFLVFVVFIVVGYYLSQINAAAARYLTKETVAKFSHLIQEMKGKAVIFQIGVIFWNNLQAAFMAVLTGIMILPFLVPVFPVTMLAGNGLVIGLVLRLSQSKSGLPVSQFVFGLLPHGVFELPAFIVAVMLGIRLGFLPHRLLWHYYKTKEYRPFFRDYFRELRYYGALVLLLLIMAAVLEITVSGAMVKGLS